jgi:predicted ABC-type ATPase
MLQLSFNTKEHDQQALLLKECEVLNLDLIYQSDPPGFAYSLPRSVLESYLSGKAFDHKEVYSREELDDLKADICDLYRTIIEQQPAKEQLAVMTAGAPGTGKTTLLKQDLAAQAKQGRVFAYVCPDDVCLKGLMRTYQKEIAERVDQCLMDGGERKKCRQEAYNKWRPGSNAATHLILAHLIRQRYGFYFGTTSSAPTTAKFLEFLKTQGYTIRLLHLTSLDQVRWESIQERDKIFVQTTEEDIREKGKLVPQRIMDTYLKFADEIEFFYRREVKEDAVLAATWKRNSNPAEGLGTLTIVDRERYEAIKKIHNAACEALGKPELVWEMAVEKSARVIDQ